MQDATSDEIDLIELIEIIWDGKWLITAITAAFAILFVGILFQIPPSFEARIDIAALDNTQIASFAPLNDTPGISQPIYSGTSLIGQKGVILSEDLFKAFVAELDRGQFFRKLMLKLIRILSILTARKLRSVRHCQNCAKITIYQSIKTMNYGEH